MTDLQNKRVAIIATDGFEYVELVKPRAALDEAGATTEVIAPHSGQLRGWNFTDWGDSVDVDRTLDEANPEDYDALLLPGGVINPDKLRIDQRAVRFVQAMFAAGKPIASICHGPWTLINAGVVAGKRMTSWPSLELDLRNAGAEWVDEPVVVDNGIVTSRKPDDIPQFNAKVLEEIAEGVHVH